MVFSLFISTDSRGGPHGGGGGGPMRGPPPPQHYQDPQQGGYGPPHGGGGGGGGRGGGGGYQDHGEYPQQYNHMQDQQALQPLPPNAPSHSGIVMVYNINLDKMNCEKLFNLMCPFGNIFKVGESSRLHFMGTLVFPLFLFSFSYFL